MAVKWKAALDPSDKADFYADFIGGDDPVLEEGEKIASYEIGLTAKAVQFGLTFDDAGEYAHQTVNNDTAVRMWLSIPEEKRDSADFCAGIDLGVEVTIMTDSVPPRRWQRTWLVTVVNQ